MTDQQTNQPSDRPTKRTGGVIGRLRCQQQYTKHAAKEEVMDYDA